MRIGARVIVGQAVSERGQRVGARGGNEEQVGLVRQRDVARLPLAREGEGIGDDRVAGEGLQRQRRDERARGLRHRNVHFVAALDELADEISRLVSRNGTGNADNDGFHKLLESGIK